MNGLGKKVHIEILEHLAIVPTLKIGGCSCRTAFCSYQDYRTIAKEAF